MQTQEAISTKTQKAHGRARVVEALIDDINADGAVARTAADAPEIDGNLFISPGESISARQRFQKKRQGRQSWCASRSLDPTRTICGATWSECVARLFRSIPVVRSIGVIIAA